MMRRFTIFVLLLAFAVIDTSFANEALVKAPPSYQPVDMTGSFIKLTFGLGFVVLAIFASAWFFRRMGRFGSLHGQNIRMLGGLNIGNRERVVLLQVGEQQILVGVTPDNIRTLHVLEKNIEVSDDFKPPLESFSNKLNQALAQWKNRK